MWSENVVLVEDRRSKQIGWLPLVRIRNFTCNFLTREAESFRITGTHRV